MRRASKAVKAAASAIAMASVISLAPMAASAAGATAIEKGKKVSLNRKKGNCLACHVITDGELPGNIAPPLVAMKARFPDKAKLRAQIYDAAIANPSTMMPRFGPYEIISAEEIDQVLEYIYSL